MPGTNRPVLGIDVGTTSISVVLLDSDDGHNILTTSRRYNADIAPDVPGGNLQDAEDIYVSVYDTVSEIVAQYPSIAGIGITGQMHGIVLTDESGGAVTPVYTWLDARLDRPDESGGSFRDRMVADLGETVSNGFGFGTVYYLSRVGRLPSTARRIATVPDYIARRLVDISRVPSSGVTSAGLAHSLGFYRPEERAFSDVIRSFLGTLTPPEVWPSGSVVGTSRWGIPVFLPEGDNQASYLGSVRDPEKALSANIGTSGQMSFFVSDGAEVDNQLPLDPRPFYDIGTLFVAATLSGGKSFEILTSLIDEICGHRDGDGGDVFDRLNKLPQPAGDELTIDTRFFGTRRSSEVRGRISGISIENFDLAHLYWGIARGIVTELVEMVGPYRSIAAGGDSYIAISGNTLERSSAVRHYLADQMGTVLRRPVECESAARGAAIGVLAMLDGGVERIPEVCGRAIRYTDEAE